MKTVDISRSLILRIASQSNRTEAIAEAGITKRQFYLAANRYNVSIRRKNSPYKLTAEDRQLIVKLNRDFKLTYRQIAEKFDVSHTTVRRCLLSHA